MILFFLFYSDFQVIKNTPSLKQLVKPASSIDQAVGFDYADGTEITYINTEIDEDYDISEEMNEIQRELEKQQKAILKKEKCSEPRLRIPKIQLLTAAEKKNLMDQIVTSCGKCGNNEPLLHVPQKDYDILFSEHMTQVHGEKDAVNSQNEYEAQMILNYRKKCKTKVVNGKTKFICTQCPEQLATFESYTEHMEWHKELKEQGKQFRQRLNTKFCIFALSKYIFPINIQFQGKYISLRNML